MNTIVEVIESQLEKNNFNCSFTFLADGENAQPSVYLDEIRNDALKISALLSAESAVLLLLPQGISFIKAFVGCLYARAVAVPTAIPGKNQGLEKLKSIVADASISCCVTSQATFDGFAKWFVGDDLLSSIRWILIENIDRENIEFSRPIELPEPHQTAFLQYTSGSTGNPKGVIVTHENIIANSKIIQACFQNNADSVSVCWLPSFHDMGLIDGIIQPIFSGFRSVMMSPTHFLQRPVRWFRAMTEYKATYSGAPNFAFDFCVNRIREEELSGIDLSGLRCLYNGSEPIRRKTLDSFSERFSAIGFTEDKLFTCYGLAEATLAVTTSILGTKPTILKIDEQSFRQNQILPTEDEPFTELIGCGHTFFDTSVKIVDPETLAVCAEKVIGEIWVSGKSITPGYLNSPHINREQFAERADTRFLRTGDLGFLYDGELFVTGRIKDLIIVRGKNHYPQDIEQTVFSSHEALQPNACAAFSFEIEQEEKLVVVQEIRRSFRQDADYNSIFSRLMAEINVKHGIAPHDIVLISPGTLPKTTSGKIQRDKCRQMWRSQRLSALAAASEHLFFA
jgi:acyl-CoA synthetase (AMP-forming)/AMP-acid ligase II